LTVFRQREGISQKHKLAVIQVTIKTLELNLKRYLYIESRIIIVLNIVSIQFWKSKRLRSIEASRLRVHVWSFIWPGVWKRERETECVCVCACACACACLKLNNQKCNFCRLWDLWTNKHSLSWILRTQLNHKYEFSPSDKTLWYPYKSSLIWKMQSLKNCVMVF